MPRPVDEPSGSLTALELPLITPHPQSDKDIRFGEWSARDVEYLNNYSLLSAKPVVYLVNMSKVRR